MSTASYRFDTGSLSRTDASTALVFSKGCSESTHDLPASPLHGAWLPITGLDISPLSLGSTQSDWHVRDLSRRLQEAIESLRRAIADLHVDDDQERPSDSTVRKAQHLLWLLPNDALLPAISVEPDGAIAFDWVFARHRMFSMTVSNSDRLAYAWLKDNDRGHGIASLSGDRLPEPIPTLLAMLSGP